jgi:hypothetical protein
LVRTARCAAARRAAADRRRADDRACRTRACREAAARPSPFSAPLIACDRRLAGGFLPWLPARGACFALRFVPGLALAGGADNFTPARRAFERPMAIACFVERAPCLPSRMWCISSRTNSPAWVVGALPARLSRRARSMVAFSGIPGPPRNSTERNRSAMIAAVRTDVLSVSHARLGAPLKGDLYEGKLVLNLIRRVSDCDAVSALHHDTAHSQV